MGLQTPDAWVALAIFLVVIAFVIKPVRLRLPFYPYWHIHLNLATAPPLGIAILLASKVASWEALKHGFLGTHVGVQPYAIMILFYSLAYLCISLDMTGLIQYSAFWVSRRAGNRGRMAFSLLFVLTSLISGLASNDVVILTGTAFLSYFTRVSGIRPTAFLMSEFTSANIASMALYIGNPTNVVVAEAFSLSFIEYSAWMLLPTVIGLLMAYGVLRIVFYGETYIPRIIHPPDEEPRSVLVDPVGAIFGLILLGACMSTLVGTSFIEGVSVWMVTLPFAVLMLGHDICYDLGARRYVKNSWTGQKISALYTAWLSKRTPNHPSVSEGSDATVMPNTLATTEGQVAVELEHLGFAGQPEDNGQDVDALRIRRRTEAVDSDTQYSEDNAQSQSTLDNQPRGFRAKLRNGLLRLPRALPTVFSVTKRMPWSILPFSFCMFILVQILSDVGWIDVCASALQPLTHHYVAALFGVMVISLIACQLLNNLPMTILFTRILQHPTFAQHASPLVLRAAVLGLVAGSNLGACLTFVGSLAGIMFDHILRTKGIYILGYFQFLKWNLLLLPLICAGVASVVVGELWFMYLR